jgi:pimeloyl-ACP methyl ester carboxylesterase
MKFPSDSLRASRETRSTLLGRAQQRDDRDVGKDSPKILFPAPNPFRGLERLEENAGGELAVSPDGQNLDNFYLARPGADEIQLDLFGDYKSNVALYPSFQQYFRTHKPPLLAVWGKNDPFFLPPGAEAFKRDNPRAVVRFLDTGHFALETHAPEIAASISDFLK